MTIPRALAPMVDRIPDEYRPRLKQAYSVLRDSYSSVRHLRGMVKAERVVWLRPEVADIESFRLLKPGSGELLVRNQATVISPGTERAFLLGLPNTTRQFPTGAGYSGAGVVEYIGSGVTGWAIGDQFAGVTPHASRALTTPDRIVHIPTGVAVEQACFVHLGAIALQAIRQADIAPGQKVVVIGLGLIGQLLIQLGRWVGAAPIIGVARTRAKESQALASGCDEVVELESDPLIAEGMTADVVIEATGSPSGIMTAIEAARRGGRVVLAGSPRGTTGGIDFGRMVQERGITIVGAHVSGVASAESAPGRWTRQDESVLFLELMERGSVNVAHLIDYVVEPFEANQVYEQLVSGVSPVMGIVFDWSEGEQTRELHGTTERVPHV